MQTRDNPLTERIESMGILHLSGGGLEAETSGVKLEIIKSEGDALILKESFTPLEALRIMRELNGASAPNLPDADLTGALARFTGTRLKGMDRFGPAGTTYEVECQGIAKRVTGRSWKLKREKKAKPAFGSRTTLWDLPDAPRRGE